MFELVLIASLWIMAGATASRLLVPNGATKRSANGFLAATFGALALTLNTDLVYAFVDPLVGGQNYVDLAKHTCLVLCAFFLAKAALRIAGRERARDSLVLQVGLVATAVVQTVAFLAVEVDLSTTDFMETFGTQPAAVVYSLSHFLYFGLAEAMTLWAALAIFRTAEDPVEKGGAIALAIGAIAAVGNVAVITLREVARLAGMTDLASALEPPYKALLILIALGNCVGLGLPALRGAARRRRSARTISPLLRTLEPAHLRVMADDRLLLQAGSEDDQLERLLIAVVGIRDAQSTQHDVILRQGELEALARAERLLGAN